MSKSAACRATKSARACYSQVINVRFQPAGNLASSDTPPFGERANPIGRMPDAIEKTVTAPPPTTYPLPTGRLRNAAMRLAAELDEAHLYRAAAYASMVVDAIDQSGGEPEQDGAMRTDIDLDFELDEHGRIWMIRKGDCHILGRANAVCSEMRRFLNSVVRGVDR